MLLLIVSVAGIIFNNVLALHQYQAGVHDWNKRLFGELKYIQVQDQTIFYQNTNNQNGIIDKSTGQVNSRNTYTMCDSYNYVTYEPNQQIIQLFNEGYSVLAEEEISDNIDHCLIGLNGEFIIIYGKTIFSTFNNKFTEKVDHQIIHAGYIFDVPVVVLQKQNEICIYQIRESITLNYCVESLNDGKIHEFGNTLIYQDAKFAYQLKEKSAKLLNFEIIKKVDKFVGYSQTLVITEKSKKQIVNLDGQVEYELSQDEFVIQNLENQKYYYILKQINNELKIVSYDRDTKQTHSEVIELQTNQLILNAFLIDQNKRQFLIQYQDLQTVLVDNKGVRWTTEQSLISIDTVFYEKYENQEQTHKNSYYESLEKHGTNNPLYLIQNFISRVLNEVKDLQEVVTHFIDNLGKEKVQTREMEQTYGLKQKVYFLTTYGTLLCYDTQELSLLIKLQINNQDKSFRLVAHHQIDSNLITHFDNNDAQPTHVLFYYSKEKSRLNTFILDLQHGIIQQVASQSSKNIVWTLPYRVEGGPGQHHNIVILIDEENNIFTYPKNDSINTKEIILYRNDNGVLRGYRLFKNELVNLWTINMKDEILIIRSSYHVGEENPRVAIWDDRKVIYKLIDHSNFAILTSDGDKLKLFIINAKTGKIIYQSVQSEADFNQPINLVFDEHQVFVTYYNKAQMMFEIWTVEIYHAKIEVSFIKMLENYYFTKTPIITNYYKADFEAFFLQQVYGYPFGIKYLGMSRTQKSLTKKNLLIITTSGQLHSLDRNLVSTRRREKADQPILEYSLQSAELPPYQYQLPINFQNMLSYHQTFDIEKFSIESTNLESSALLLVYGSDIFFTRIAPDKTYDMLLDNFNYNALIATTVLILVATKVLSKLVKSSKQVKQFYLN
ncbi:unnamed protein product [Paramecium octaurelia]|uniref:ER membrane protein complex subunit 1 n=1 Tax=Paramecium octaurelia TaxID=43137 RepID=A0A8S1S2R2_PAROT|nr:unnamed protein product [Paramecium octaurelia]